MAGRGRAMTNIVKLGVKYGPAAYEVVKHGREPAQAAAQKAYARMSARRQALAHAAALVDGSVYQTFSGDQPVWVVFSGDEPVAAHPATDVSPSALLGHADLGKRIRPDEVGRKARRLSRARRTGAQGDQATPEASVRPDPGEAAPSVTGATVDVEDD
jgi:hypothetical protein